MRALQDDIGCPLCDALGMLQGTGEDCAYLYPHHSGRLNPCEWLVVDLFPSGAQTASHCLLVLPSASGVLERLAVVAYY